MNTLAAMAVSLGLVAASAPLVASAEEGMWTFDEFPAARVEQSLGVRLDRPWLDHLEGATVRLTTGCSGAVVSRQGLVLTNQHCILACAQDLSPPRTDYIRDGFFVSARGDERSCPGLQGEILTAIVDITHAVFDASARKFGEDYVAAREGVFSKAERKICGSNGRLRCQVIAFYGGGQFKVYKYRVYPDVRLVFAPEYAVAFFGGDPDNFSFPRYALDAAFLRLYEGGAPARIRDWLAWSTAPPKDGQAVFVSGAPGATQRGLTVSQLETQRDVVIPVSVARRAALRGRLLAFAASGPEAARLAADPLFVQENDLKLLRGRGEVLGDSAFLAVRAVEEGALKARLAGDAKLAAEIGNPWSEIEAIQKTYAQQYIVWRELESDAGGGSRLFAYARGLVRGAAERAKPSPQRLPEYADSRLALTGKALLDDKPIAADLERLYLEFWLSTARQALGPDSLAAKAMLGGETAQDLARRLVDGSRLTDPTLRRTLWEGGAAVVAASDDPLIAYVLRTDPVSRAARELWQNEVVGPSDRAGERIVRVRFVAKGGGLYPDATFSPRLSFGTVAGWRDGGTTIGPFTNFAGLYTRATGQAPFALPPRWLGVRGGVEPDAVLNFVTTNDITGGNSGSPLVDARGRIVGAAFDGNRPSIAGDFAYDGAANRTVAVSTAAITEALVKVYGRGDLVAEVEGR